MSTTNPFQIEQPSLIEKYDEINTGLMSILVRNKSFRICTNYGAVYKSVKKVCSKFLNNLYMRKKIKRHNNSLYCKLIPYGSYKLHTVNIDSDIDFLFLVPKFVRKNDIFSNLFRQLQKTKLISNLRKIDEAYVPLIKFSIFDVKVDLTYAIINKNFIDSSIDDKLMDDRILRGMIQSSIIALNGLRSTMMLLDMIPDTRQKLFQEINRFLKIWAKNRIISGNIFGYFGGINIAIITTYALQRIDSDSPSFIILEIFRMLSSWNWPKPLIINPIKQSQDQEFQPWSSDENGEDVMPIITPTFPAINSMRNATNSSRHRIMQEVDRAQKYTERILNHKAEWSQLLAPPHFFRDHRTFIEICCSSKSRQEQITTKGFIEKNIRNLSKFLESRPFIKYAVIFPHAFRDLETPNSYCYYIALNFIYMGHNSSNQSYSDSDGNSPSSPYSTESTQQQIINACTTFSQTLAENKQISKIFIRVKQRQKLPNYVLEIDGQSKPPQTRINPETDGF